MFADVDGVICTSGRDDLLREQGPMCAPDWVADDLRGCQAACAAACVADPAGVAWRERTLEGVFALAHFPDAASARETAASLADNLETLGQLTTWVDRHRTSLSTPPIALDVGCGPGRFTCELAPRFAGGVTAFDLRIGVLRLLRRLVTDGEASLPWRVGGREFRPLTVRAPAVPHGSVRLVQGNLLQSPLAPARHDLVAALSLVDVLPDPTAGLAALTRLVAPGGLLLVASPWHWDVGTTPPGQWWEAPEQALREHLTARGYTLLEDADLPWCIPSHARLVHRYRLQAVLARRPATGSRPVV